MGGGKGAEGLVLKQPPLPCSQRRPRLHLDVPAFHVAAVLLPLEESVALNQVDSGLHLVPEHEICQLVRGKVVHADGTGLSGGVQLFQCTPCAVVVVVGLVDEVQVYIVQPQPLHGAGKAALCALVAGVGDPQLRGNEQFLARHTAAADGTANGFFVFVSGSGINEPVAVLDGLHYGFFTLCRVLHAEHAVTDGGYFYAIVQSDGRDHTASPFVLRDG